MISFLLRESCLWVIITFPAIASVESAVIRDIKGNMGSGIELCLSVPSGIVLVKCKEHGLPFRHLLGKGGKFNKLSRQFKCTFYSPKRYLCCSGVRVSISHPQKESLRRATSRSISSGTSFTIQPGSRLTLSLFCTRYFALRA